MIKHVVACCPDGKCGCLCHLDDSDDEDLLDWTGKVHGPELHELKRLRFGFGNTHECSCGWTGDLTKGLEHLKDNGVEVDDSID